VKSKSQTVTLAGERFESLQALRAIAAVAVLIFHLRFVELRYLEGHALLDWLGRNADAGVDLFFVLSGFVMASISRGKGSGPSAARDFLTQRAWRVVPLYWMFTTLVVLLMSVAPAMVNSSYADQSIAASYLLIPHQQLPVLAVGWTLVHEAYFYLVFSLALALAYGTRQRLSLFAMAWGSLVGFGYWQGFDEGAPTASVVFSPLTFEFLAGVLTGLHWRRIPPRFGSLLFITGLGVLLLAAALLPPSDSEFNAPLRRVIHLGLGSALLIAGSALLETSGHRPNRLLIELGDASYSLYLSHIFVISAIGRMWGHFLPSAHWLNHGFFLLFTVFVACLSGNLIHKRIERPLLDLRYRWKAAGTFR
jgi:peptidoglycan/LPS O-acetylase OafA/YrhL